jgi:hypothetical protein
MELLNVKTSELGEHVLNYMDRTGYICYALQGVLEYRWQIKDANTWETLPKQAKDFMSQVWLLRNEPGLEGLSIEEAYNESQPWFVSNHEYIEPYAETVSAHQLRLRVIQEVIRYFKAQND